jgi:hypothetical protein
MCLPRILRISADVEPPLKDVMKRPRPSALSCLLLVAGLLLIAVQPAVAMPDGTSRTSFYLQASSSPRDIYSPLLPIDYRTSPSVILEPSGQYDQFNCGPEDGGTTQVIRSLTSADSHVWSTPTVALRPTPNGPDAGGVCDPSVVRLGSYYVMAYIGAVGSQHALFVARTTSLSQPWQKWNGQGWGGPATPKPIVTPDPGPGYGIGQPSLVVSADQLNIFYDVHTWVTWQTRLAAVPLPLTDTWPAQVKQAGVVLRHPGRDAASCAGFYDATHVAYDVVRRQYVAVTVDSQDYATPSVQTYESRDGSSFTRALTLGLPAGGSAPTPPRSHDLSLVTDEVGDLDSPDSPSLVFSYGGTDCPVKLAWQDLTVGALKTGWTSTLTPTAGAKGWDYDPDQWNVDSSGALKSRGVLRDGPAFATYGAGVTGSNAVIDLDYSEGLFPFALWDQVAFGQTPGGLGGYTLRIYTTGNVSLFDHDPDHPLATGQMSGSGYWFPNHLQVVVSGATVTAYSGLGGGSLLSPILQYTASSNVNLTGYLGVGAYGPSTAFSNLTVRDDVPADYRSQDDTPLDWKPTAGAWRVRAPSTLASLQDGESEIFLQGRSAPTANYNAHLGDGTYTATVQLSPGSPALSWGGLDITNADAQLNPSWRTGGYLVFVRANGNVGVYRTGIGQIGPDYPTGLDPVATPVTLTVLKTGGNVQVYVNHNPLPTIMYTDHASPYTVGTFGVATHETEGVITNVAYTGINGTTP